LFASVLYIKKYFGGQHVVWAPKNEGKKQYKKEKFGKKRIYVRYWTSSVLDTVLDWFNVRYRTGLVKC
jgi:hypothetical protein